MLSEREALDIILALTPEQFETPGLVAGTDHNPDRMACLREGIRTVLSNVQWTARRAGCIDSALKTVLEDLVAWEASPGMSMKWKYGDSSVGTFSVWADGIWENARKILKWT